MEKFKRKTKKTVDRSLSKKSPIFSSMSLNLQEFWENFRFREIFLMYSNSNLEY